MANNNSNSGGRGFAGMDDAKQREIASKGGKASHSNDNSSSGNNSESGQGNDSDRGGSQ